MSSDLKKDPLVDSFLSSLRLEKGLSENTIKAYSNDCQAFKKWLFLNQRYDPMDSTAVSYTHLTLPTICSV